MTRSAAFEQMGNDYYLSNHKHTWHRFAPAWCAIQAQDFVSEPQNKASVTRQTLKWWSEAVKFGFIDC